MLDLESAIKHAEEVANEQDMKAGFETNYSCYQMSDTERNQCKKCAEEHRQLAEWLKELKRLREQTNVPATNDGDTISRQAAIDILDDLANDYESGKWDNSHSEARGRMINLPPVEPERKMGKWHLLDECANEGWYCDQCHKKVFKADFSNTMRKYNFCPNCGSRMEVNG